LKYICSAHTNKLLPKHSFWHNHKNIKMKFIVSSSYLLKQLQVL